MHYTTTRAAALEQGRQPVRCHRGAAPSSQHTTKVETGGQTPALRNRSEGLCCPLFLSLFLGPLRRLSSHALTRARAGASAEIRCDITLRGQKKPAHGFVRGGGDPTAAQRGLPAASSLSATGSWLSQASPQATSARAWREGEIEPDAQAQTECGDGRCGKKFTKEACYHNVY